MFNSLVDKQPYGASVVGQPTTFTFALPASYGAEKVYVIVRKGGEHRRAELPFCRFDGDNAVFEGSVTVHESGLWYYRFESVSKGTTTYYGRASGGDAVAGEWLPEWQLTGLQELLFRMAVLLCSALDGYLCARKLRQGRPLGLFSMFGGRW